MKIGRPSKDIEKRVTVGLDKEMYSKICYLSSKEGISVSEYVRKILKKSVK